MSQTFLIRRSLNFGTDEVTGALEVVSFDSTITEDHSFEIAIVDDPVDTGVSLADHAYAKPRTLTMEVAVSDTPLLGDDAGTPSYQLATTWTEGGARRSVNAWDFIDRKAHEFAVFDIQTGLKLYQNMMFETGSALTSKDTAGCLRAKLKLRQVMFAITASVLYPPRAPKHKKSGAAPTDSGRKESSEPKPSTQKPVSVIAGFLGIGKK
jgi:hypothetical protein